MSLVRRRLVGFGGLIAALVVVGVGIHFMDRHDEAAERDAAASAKVVGVTAADVSAVTLENSNGRFVIVRDGSAWRLTEPLATGADPSVVDGLVAAVADVSRTQKIEVDGKAPAASDLGMFGLAPPRVSVTVATPSVTKTLDIGKRNDFNGELYARVRDSDAVVMVGAALDFQVGKALFDLREKRLLVFEPADVTSLDVSRGRGELSYSLVRDNGESTVRWAGAEAAVAADPTQVSGLFSAIANLRATRFVSDVASDADRKAFTAPDTVRARLTLGGTTRALALAHVSDSGSERWLATLENEPAPVIEVSGDWLVRKLDVDGRSLRDLRVVAFKREDVGLLTIARGEASVTLAAGEGGAWTITAATPALGGLPREADASRVSGLLYKLYGMRAEQVLVEKASDAELAAVGLDNPSLQVTLAHRDGSELAALLAGGEAQGGTAVTQRGRGRIDVLGKGQLEDISANVTDYLPAEAQATK